MHKSPSRSSALRRFAIAGFLAVLFAGSAPTVADEIAVVVNPGVAVSEISFADLRKIMLGDRQFWVSGQKITLIVRGPVAQERTALLEKVYKMSEAQFRQYWVAKVFRAEVTAGPRVVLSNDEATDLVAVLDGAVVAINARDVPEGLKVLKIDGRLPGDAGYPLRY